MSLIVTHLGGGQTTADLTLQHFGSILTGSGILTPSSFTVSALTSPGMKVQVSGSSNDDKAVIITDSGDTYFIKNLQNAEVTILANTSGVTKTDAIVLYVDLLAGDPNNAGSPGAAKLIAVRHDEAGIGTGAPTDGEIDAATNNNQWVKLREVTVEHGAGEIEETDLSYEAVHAQMDASLLSALPNNSVGTGQIKPEAVTAAKVSDDLAANFSYPTTETLTSAIFLGNPVYVKTWTGTFSADARTIIDGTMPDTYKIVSANGYRRTLSSPIFMNTIPDNVMTVSLDSSNGLTIQHPSSTYSGRLYMIRVFYTKA